MYLKFSNWLWGFFLLFAAALIVANQFGGFVEIGLVSVIIAALALAMFISSLLKMSFGSLPIPIAIAYYVFQEPLGFPVMKFWPLVLVTVLACAGISILVPGRWKRKNKFRKTTITGNIGDTNESSAENNPVIDVHFGAVSRYIHADSLESAVLNCQFGGIDVYFDKATVSPNGAEIICNCQFGGIDMYVPKRWHIIDNINCTMGGVDISNMHAQPDADAPVVTISGNCQFGGIDISRV
jgi:predicted membrane protein